MDRRRGRSDPEVADTGSLGYRHDWEPVDERPLFVEYSCQCKGCRDHSGFWRDQSERLEYEHAVETNPIQPGEGPMAYAARISGIVTGRLEAAAKRMPARGQGRVARDRQLARLRAQAQGMGDGWESYG